jgi:16S rRNA processing protein RimM
LSDSNDAGWVAVAVLGKARGNRGEITAWPLSSKPDRYQSLHEVFLFASAERPANTPAVSLAGQLPPDGQRFVVDETWFHQGTLIIKFAGVDSISDAERLTGMEVRIPASQRIDLEPGEYFTSDLIGCDVIERGNGNPLGKVTGWLDSGGPGLLEVGDILIPFARAICVEIDPAARRIVVELPEGLKDLNRP